MASRSLSHQENNDIQADYRIRDTNVTQQSGAGQGTANLVDKVIAQKQRIQPDATLCIEYKKRKAPPKGFEPLFPIGEIGVLGH